MRELEREFSSHRCPHCGVESRFERYPDLLVHVDRFWKDHVVGAIQVFDLCRCPSCERAIVRRYEFDPSAHLGRKERPTDRFALGRTLYSEHKGYGEIVYPRGTVRRKAPVEAPEDVRTDFNEAASIEALSPKACAALGRRLLEHILETAGGTGTSGTLVAKVDKVEAKLPLEIAASLHALREIGNFAAHPRKDSQTGAVLDVEPGEASHVLDTLELLMDHYYVRAAKREAAIKALNDKLAKAGKKPV
jgi:hypothetical protein